MKKIITAVMLLCITGSVLSQHQEVFEKPETYKGRQVFTTDTTSILSAFKRGHFNGHFRYFFMSTQNKKGLTDYFANAAGGGLRYETAQFKGFQFCVSGFYTFNIGSSNLAKADSATSQFNRYEIGLFDVEDALNKKDIDRLEELFLKYSFKKSSIVFGKQLLNTPFINLQDGRMRPTGVEGIWMETNEIKKIKIEGGWLYAVSPRGTTKWYSVAESVGIYPAGVNSDGTKSQYRNNLKSKGVFMLAAHVNINQKIKLQAWNLLAENIFNTTMLQADVKLPEKENQTFFAAAQLIYQRAVNNGGNADAAKTYFQKNAKSLTFGVKAGYINKRFENTVNYNRITASSRYLMPREWGREPFFTFLPRERNEGLADAHAIMYKADYAVTKARAKIAVAIGYYKLPDVKNTLFNKYGLPSYVQINADFRYFFKGLFNGMEAQALVVAKIKSGTTYNNNRFEFNKVNMLLYNFILNYHF